MLIRYWDPQCCFHNLELNNRSRNSVGSGALRNIKCMQSPYFSWPIFAGGEYDPFNTSGYLFRFVSFAPSHRCFFFTHEQNLLQKCWHKIRYTGVSLVTSSVTTNIRLQQGFVSLWRNHSHCHENQAVRLRRVPFECSCLLQARPSQWRIQDFPGVGEGGANSRRGVPTYFW